MGSPIGFSPLTRRFRLIDRPLSIQFFIAGGVVLFFSFSSFIILLAQFYNKMHLSRQVTFLFILSLSAFLTIVFGIILFNLYKAIVKPMSRLIDCMSRYQNGEFSVRVPVSNKSEIGYLESSFNRMAERIERMVEDLKKLDDLKTEFISTISHELRTPLTSIGGYIQCIAAEEAGPITLNQKEFLAIIETNVIRLARLIDEVLDVESLEAGKIRLEKQPQNLVSILKECRDTFRIAADQKGLEFRSNVPPVLMPVMGDRSRLVQIFMNLISNSIKYTNKGFVEIDAEQNNLAVVVRVRDSGVGLTDEEKKSIFQKFFRARSDQTSMESGTGLGLVIVQGLVEAHGGKITVESQPGKGTEFCVTLPLLAQTEQREGTNLAKFESQSGKLWKILLVTPDSVLRSQLKSQFKEKGICIDDVVSGNLVLDQLNHEYYDLVLIDVQLADLSGIELVKIIRRNPKFLDLAISIIDLGNRKNSNVKNLSQVKVSHVFRSPTNISGIVAYTCDYLGGTLN